MSSKSLASRFGALVAAVVLGLSSAAAAAGQDLGSKAPEARALAHMAERDGSVPVIVELKAAAPSLAAPSAAGDRALKASAARAIDRFLARQSAGLAGTMAARRPVKRMTFLPMVALDATPADLRRIAADPDVVAIHRDRPVPPTLDQTVPLVGADQVAATGQVGADGIVAVLDTGVDAAHPFLSGKVIAEACFSTTSSYPSQSLCPGGAASATGPGSGEDCASASYGSACAHGTHVAGIAAGNGNGGAPKQGVAAGAPVFAIQVFSWFPNQNAVLSWSSDQVRALEHVYARRADFPGKRIAAVNMSLGGGRYAGYCTDSPLTTVIGKLRSAGILTVIAAGNNGYTDSMSSPACTPGAVSVASSTKTDGRSGFTNISPVTTLYAPGSSIVSSVPGTGYATYSGTSMATPHVAGALAVLASAFPAATADQLVDALVATGKPLATGAGTTLPRIDVKAAFTHLGGSGGGGGGGETPVANLQVAPTDPVVLDRSGSSVTPKSFGLMVSARTGTQGWTLSGVPSWLRASATGGTATTAGSTVTFTVRLPKRQKSDLTATLAFTPTSGVVQPITVPVTLRLVDQTLALAPRDRVRVLNVAGRAATPSSFAVTLATNVGSARWRLSGLPSWLAVSQRWGVATPEGTTITLTPRPGRAGGTVSATLTFHMLDGGRPVRLPVTMELENRRFVVRDERSAGRVTERWTAR